MTTRKIAACDCETDPFKFNRVPHPFLWGYYEGTNRSFESFTNTGDFVDYVKHRHIILYAHNGGKFDFMYLLPFVGETRVQIINGRIVSMMLGRCELRDSYSIMPTKLAELGSKKEILHWKLEADVRDDHWSEIVDYLYMDCKVLYDAVINFRDMAGKHKTIASNALAYSKKIGVDPGKSSYRFDNEMRKFYFGGRTQCFQPGMHRDIGIIDIRSAYPYAMKHDHPTGTQYNWRSNLEGMTDDEINRSFISISCYSNGCFPVRDGVRGLRFPVQKGEFHVTGWEYNAALSLGLISDIQIENVRTTSQTINFSPYILHWYAAKATLDKKLQPAMYYIVKTMMNSLYGKLAQNPARYYDYKIVKAGTRIEHEEGWELAQEYTQFEIHKRETLWRYKAKYGEDWISKPIYKNVATGASITGFVRALLLRTIHNIGLDSVIYCDTDSVIYDTRTGDVSNINFSEQLGAWELEDRKAPIGYFAGKKLYAIRNSFLNHKTGKPAEKIASKGAKLTFDQIKAMVMDGAIIEWRSDAPAFNFLGLKNAKNKFAVDVDANAKFVVRKLRSTAGIFQSPIDERLT